MADVRVGRIKLNKSCYFTCFFCKHLLFAISCRKRCCFGHFFTPQTIQQLFLCLPNITLIFHHLLLLLLQSTRMKEAGRLHSRLHNLTVPLITANFGSSISDDISQTLFGYELWVLWHMEGFFGFLQLIYIGVSGYSIFEHRWTFPGLLEIFAVAVLMVVVFYGFEEFVVCDWW